MERLNQSFDSKLLHYDDDDDDDDNDDDDDDDIVNTIIPSQIGLL